MTLYLLPNLLDENSDHTKCMPAYIAELIASLDGIICETEKPTRKFLARFKKAQLPLQLLNEHTKEEELTALLEPLIKGERWGLISDAGLPCIADPGSALVRLCHKKGIHVEALVGPCSVIMALQLSGFSGQRFSFHGYLPREKEARKMRIKSLEQKSKKEHSSEIFIEAPYRNQELLEALVQELHPTTELFIACDLMSPTQELFKESAREWKQQPLPPINKRPCIFILFVN